MADVFRVRIDVADANRLGKWSSLWADLLHADMALEARSRLNDSNALADVFQRRALWESAIVSYGRMEASDKRRRLDHTELIEAVRGQRGVEMHGELMRWRHDHVAHRLSRDLEEAVVYGEYNETELTALRVAVSTSAGPANDDPFVIEFHEHVKALRDALWETELVPAARKLAAQGHLPEGEAPREPRKDWLTVTQTLWSR